MSDMNDIRMIDPGWAWQPFEPTTDRPWNRSMVAHLYRRAGFGADLQMLDTAVQQSPADVVHELVSQHRESSDFRDIADSLAETVLAGGDPKQLSAAWLYRLLLTPGQLLEKMTLFWHGHFATGADKVKDARMMWDQNKILRSFALGDFGTLVQAIAKDPAMLIYLDSANNRKAHPNENFARELMELFCLGEGNYSEQDVQELARCFTGWEVKIKKFRKNLYQHDDGTKSILGRNGNFDGEDGVHIVLEQPQLEQFLARKWYHFFVSDEPEPTAELLNPIAKSFRQHDLKVAPVLELILGSNLFFSRHSIGRKIKSPVELVVGTMRCLRATTNTQRVAQGLTQIGQGLFYPPNVKGWDGGRAWVNSSTLIGRSNLIADILENSSTQFDGHGLSEYLNDLGASTIDQAIDHFQQCLLPFSLTDSARMQLHSAFNLPPDAKDRSMSNDRESKLRSLLHAFTSLPECQLG